jgi:response regulator RpfG family c-di-GMP phosphodiesterase
MDKSENGIILIVEGDKFIRLIVEKLCSPIYDIKTLENGEKALEYLKSLDKTKRPWVIISNQVMPKMKGTDFLKQTQETAPDAVKILLTAQEQTKEIVKSMQKANAFLYQPKPFDNLQLLQSIKVCIDKYKSRRNISVLRHNINDLTNKSDQYKKKIGEMRRHIERMKESGSSESSGTKSGIDIGAIKYISFIVSQSEKWYFTPHTKEVTSIATHLARQMDLSKEKIQAVTLASMIHNIHTIMMPPKLQVIQPFLHIDETLQKEFRAYYYKNFEQLTTVESLGPIAKLSSMTYEKYDGSGLPEGLGGMHLPIEGQILSISNLYHDLVYKIKKRHVEQLKSEGSFKQSYKETMERHNEAIAFMFKHVKWFDQDLLNMFKDCARRGSTKHLQPVKDTLEIIYNREDHLVVEKKLSSKEQYEEEQKEKSIQRVKQIKKDGSEVNRKIEIKKVELLEAGMELNDDIKTDKGSVVINKGTVLDEPQIQKLNKMLESNLIQKITSIIYDDTDDLGDADGEDLWGQRDIVE